MNVSLAFQNLDQRIEFQIAARSDQVGFAGRFPAVVIVPGFLVFLRFGKRLANHFLDPQPGLRITNRGGRLRTKVRLLGIFAEREFYARQRSFKRQFAGGPAPTQLDDGGLAADGVGAAVQDVGGGHAAGQVVVNDDIVGVQDVLDVDHRRDAHAAFVDAAIHGDVRMAIDDSGHHEFAGGVNYRGARGNCDVRAYRGDLAVTNQNRTMLDGPVGDGENGGVSNYGDARRLRASRGRNEHREQRREANH